MLADFNKYLLSLCPDANDLKFLLAVSGGIDSIVMAHLFHSTKLKFSIAHCNFQLRGNESEADQIFVEALAVKYETICYTVQFNTSSYAEQNGISIQMAARDLRYNWFETIAIKEGHNLVAVGHNKNDVVETMLLNLSRGTGIRGLMGIRPMNNNIIRPLLFASREEITQYARENNLQWREDASNSETKYHRNKIRHTIIPAFETINPAFIQNALDTIKRIEQTGKLLDLELEKIKKEVWTELPDRILVDIEKLKMYPANDIVLFELLRDFGIAQLNVDKIIDTFNATPGKQFHSHSHTFTRDRANLIITANGNKNIAEKLIEKDMAMIDQPINLKFKRIEYSPDYEIPRKPNIAAIDADKIKFPLMLRKWKPGDRFHPLGLKGSKKISDFLINIKTSLPDKEKIWIIETGEEIIWLVNHRIDDRFKVTDRTRIILLIEFIE